MTGRTIWRSSTRSKPTDCPTMRCVSAICCISVPATSSANSSTRSLPHRATSRTESLRSTPPCCGLSSMRTATCGSRSKLVVRRPSTHSSPTCGRSPAASGRMRTRRRRNGNTTLCRDHAPLLSSRRRPGVAAAVPRHVCTSASWPRRSTTMAERMPPTTRGRCPVVSSEARDLLPRRRPRYQLADPDEAISRYGTIILDGPSTNGHPLHPHGTGHLHRIRIPHGARHTAEAAADDRTLCGCGDLDRESEPPEDADLDDGVGGSGQ